MLGSASLSVLGLPSCRQKCWFSTEEESGETIGPRQLLPVWEVPEHRGKQPGQMDCVKQENHKLPCSREFLVFTWSRQVAHRTLPNAGLPSSAHSHLWPLWGGQRNISPSSQAAEEQQEDAILPLVQSFGSPALSTTKQSAFQQSHLRFWGISCRCCQESICTRTLS